MKLAQVRIQNFRSFRDVSVTIGDYTCLVGPNGAGKSSVIAALNVFFRNASTSPTGVADLQEEDFHHRNTSDPIKITLTFEALSDEAANDLKHYYRQGKLIVSAEAKWDEARRAAHVEQHGVRLVMTKFKRYFAMDAGGSKADDLKKVYEELRGQFQDLPVAKTKQAMLDALREYEEGHPDLCEEGESPAEFYGFTRGQGRLDKYIQWVHVPAVKDAADEDTEGKTTWLGQLLERAVRQRVNFQAQIETIRGEAQKQYATMLGEQQAALSEISGALTSRMQEWAHPDAELSLKWEGDPANSVKVQSPYARLEAKDGGFFGALVRHGHGFQRSYLLALLQELVAGGGDSGPRLLLACEEPELYQHPPQARHLANVFFGLSEKGNQVLVCTHSPLFIGSRSFEDVRLFRRRQDTKVSEVAHTTLADLKKELEAAGHHPPKNVQGARVKLETVLNPSINELFFAPILVLVEGLEDAAYLNAEVEILGKATEFRRLGCHVVPAAGKEWIPQLQAIAKLLHVPTFTVFDGDDGICGGAPPAEADKLQSWKSRRGFHEKDNAAILHLSLGPGHGLPAMPTGPVWRNNLVQWHDNIRTAVEDEIGKAELISAEHAVRKAEHLEESDLKKNPIFVGLVLKQFHDQGKAPLVLGRLVDAVLKFAETARRPPIPAVAGE